MIHCSPEHPAKNYVRSICGPSAHESCFRRSNYLTTIVLILYNCLFHVCITCDANLCRRYLSRQFRCDPPVEQSPDSMSVPGPDNRVIRLPAYSKGAPLD